MATIPQTKKQIEKALKQIVAISNIEGRIDFTYDLPEGENMRTRIEAFDKMLETIEIEGLSRYNHIFSKGRLEIYICSK